MQEYSQYDTQNRARYRNPTNKKQYKITKLNFEQWQLKHKMIIKTKTNSDDDHLAHNSTRNDSN